MESAARAALVVHQSAYLAAVARVANTCAPATSSDQPVTAVRGAAERTAVGFVPAPARQNAAPFAAYLDLPEATILSASPERFLHVDAAVTWRRGPIKGTRPRGIGPEHDAALGQALTESAKDRAENLMIVDLMRNDLSRVCAPGRVRVPELFALERYATVHHLVSTVVGELEPGLDALDLLRAAFPGGSITGAPKLRAMEIIAELEPSCRSVYCGRSDTGASPASSIRASPSGPPWRAAVAYTSMQAVASSRTPIPSRSTARRSTRLAGSSTSSPCRADPSTRCAGGGEESIGPYWMTT